VGDFVISSEEAIAKGIRRIVALTGPEATRAIKKAEALEQRVNAIAGEDQGRLIIDLSEEISHAAIPYWKKDDLRNQLKEMKKVIDDKERASKAQVMTQIVEDIKREFTDNPPKELFVVRVLPAHNNTKASSCPY
jgi:alanyl-tRNA synthetase